MSLYHLVRDSGDPAVDSLLKMLKIQTFCEVTLHVFQQHVFDLGFGPYPFPKIYQGLREIGTLVFVKKLQADK